MGRRPNRPAITNRMFIKVLFSGFKKKLVIPREYVMLHRETLGKECVLWPTHTHDSWRVRTKRIDSELYFKEGWNEFAKRHSLQFGDLLIFRHVRNSEFDVDVVDKSGTPKETLASKHDQFTKDTAPAPTIRQKKAILKTAALTAAEALVASSEYPSFVKLMKAAYVRSGAYLHVPQDFSMEHMKDYPGDVKIELSDKVWTVNVLKRHGDIKTLLSRGWSYFARANALQVDDVCVFELINSKDYTLKLTIFRHTSEKYHNRKQSQGKLKSSDSELIKKSKELADKAFEEAEKFQSVSEYHSIVIVMQPAYVEHKFLHVPSAFHEEMYKKEGENEVKLQCSGEERKATMRNVRGQCRISKGWGTFVKEKCIKVDDVCVLELINKKENVIKISIFRCNC